jgi:L-ascorbate 6-phosphate lactonase
LPVFIEPEDLWVDLVLLTHSHLDPETIRRFTRKYEARFFAPWQTWRLLPELGVYHNPLSLIHPLQTLEFRGLKVTGTWFVSTDATDLNHMGFVVEFANGMKFYKSGDPAFDELLAHAKNMAPQVMSICINSGFNNLSPWDAARVVNFVQPHAVIPAHNDMVVCNQQARHLRKLSASTGGYSQLYTNGIL